MKEIRWLEGNRAQIDPPKKTKKVTGTRFATLLGLNPWSTPFEMWLAITRTYEKPFEDTIYTAAGKIIEPKQAEYMRKSYGMELRTPTNIWGEDYFRKTWGDFFPDEKICGGMWDFIGVNDETGEVDTVLEMKTTKRSEDWKDDVPEYYALQAALYAYLLGVDNVIMVASFLESKDYEHPEKFVPSVANTITVEFKVSERYPDFNLKVARVEQWWKDHVETGISPPYDEKRDAEILKALRTNSLTPDTDISKLIAKAESLKAKRDSHMAEFAEEEKAYKLVSEQIKKLAINHFRPGDKAVELNGNNYTWSISRSESMTIDKDALKADGILSKYQKKTETYKLTVK